MSSSCIHQKPWSRLLMEVDDFEWVFRMNLNECVIHQTVLFTIFALSVITTNLDGYRGLECMDTVLLIISMFHISFPWPSQLPEKCKYYYPHFSDEKIESYVSNFPWSHRSTKQGFRARCVLTPNTRAGTWPGIENTLKTHEVRIFIK